MRKQIAAANWKMNLTLLQAESLLADITGADIRLKEHQQALFAVPFPYLSVAKNMVEKSNNYSVAAQNCYSKKSGAYTGEVSAGMLHSIDVQYCLVGHSERREYFHESNQELAQKIDLLFEEDIVPVFCCGESLEIRESNSQNGFVATQLKESLFHLSSDQASRLIIAYEPIWAIGTGKTATTGQAQEMHGHIRSVLAEKYGDKIAGIIPILYGGSVKASNADELFSQPDVDGGLVGGASLIAADFVEIIKALK